MLTPGGWFQIRLLSTLAARALAAAVTLAGAWIMLDLYLRVDLPGAALMAHAAFRAIVGPLEWLTEGEGTRLLALLLLWAGGASLSWLRPGVGRLFWSFTALLAAGAMLLVVALGLLMERALGGGLALALLAAWQLGALERGPLPGARRARRWPLMLATFGVGALACYWIYALFMTYGDGYPLLDLLGSLLRDGGVDFLGLYAAALATVTLAAAALVLRRRGPRGRRLGGLALAAVAGVVAALLLDWLLALQGPWWTPALVLPAGLALAALTRFGSGRGVAGLPRALLVPFVLAVLLVGHTYAARVFRCPDAATAPYLTRLASLPEVFRVTLFRQRTRLALSIRADRKLGWIMVQPNIGAVRHTDPGAARGRSGRASALAGVPEDFVHAPALDRFFVSLTANDLHAVKINRDVSYRGELSRGDEINNLIAVVSGDASRVLDVVGVPGLCWLNCMRWNDPERLLYLGCEDRPGLFRYDPARRVFRDGTIHPSIGDVQDIAFDPGARRLYTVSLWKTPRLTELDWRTLAIRRQVDLGGSHYDVIHDPPSRRVFASAWYASRVRVVSTDSFQVVDRIPTGLGTRALALARRQRLLLVSSIYDGRLRICDAASGKLRAALQVGGHVKEIAVDQQRSLAYFWSQCGLYRLDLKRWAAAQGTTVGSSSNSNSGRQISASTAITGSASRR